MFAILKIVLFKRKIAGVSGLFFLLPNVLAEDFAMVSFPSPFLIFLAKNPRLSKEHLHMLKEFTRDLNSQKGVFQVQAEVTLRNGPK